MHADVGDMPNISANTVLSAFSAIIADRIGGRIGVNCIADAKVDTFNRAT